MGFRIKKPRRKPQRREIGADLADFMVFAAGYLTQENEAHFDATLGRFSLTWRGDPIYCGYAVGGTITVVGTKGPPTVEKIASLVEASFARSRGVAVAAADANGSISQ
jgi:hypothetical protein